MMPPKNRQAFTFVELLLVMSLIGLIMGLAITQMSGSFQRPIINELSSLTRLINALRNEAILGQNVYYLVFDTEKQTLHVERDFKDGSRSIIDTPSLLKKRSFSGDFPLKRIAFSANSSTEPDLNQKSFEPLSVRIDSSGFVDPFTLYFLDQKDTVWRIHTRNLMGKLEFKEGMKDYNL